MMQPLYTKWRMLNLQNSRSGELYHRPQGPSAKSQTRRMKDSAEISFRSQDEDIRTVSRAGRIDELVRIQRQTAGWSPDPGSGCWDVGCRKNSSNFGSRRQIISP